MGWGRPAPLRCELNLLDSPYGAGWVNKESLCRVLLVNFNNQQFSVRCQHVLIQLFGEMFLTVGCLDS